jgi:hypothetical protein
MAAIPRLVMRSATAPFSSSRRQIGSAPRAGISSIKPWVRSLPRQRLQFPEDNLAIGHLPADAVLAKILVLS